MTILDEAAKLTSGDRNRDYGTPRENIQNTATLWSAYLSRSAGAEITVSGRDVAMMMVLVKVSRDANAPKPDNLVDIAGWARVAEMLEEPAVRDVPTAIDLEANVERPADPCSCPETASVGRLHHWYGAGWTCRECGGYFSRDSLK